MTHLPNHADQADVARTLVILSLDVMDGPAPQFGLPVLDGPEREILHRWLRSQPDLTTFPYNVDFPVALAQLVSVMPATRGQELVDGAVSASAIVDASQPDTPHWPNPAFDSWIMALRVACDEDAFALLDLPTAQEEALVAALRRFDRSTAAGDADAMRYKKEWDPHDPDQIAYNRRIKTAWDLNIYDTLFIPNSVMLDFALAQCVRNQAMRQFLAAYTESLASDARNRIRHDLPTVVTGLGLYAHHPWQRDRLVSQRHHAPDIIAQLLV